VCEAVRMAARSFLLLLKLLHNLYVCLQILSRLVFPITITNSPEVQAKRQLILKSGVCKKPYIVIAVESLEKRTLWFHIQLEVNVLANISRF
jgi:hypothetical protein